MRLPPIQPRSRRAHEAAKWAASRERFDEFNAAVFRAFFERGADIGSVEVLLELARDLELDKSDLGEALANKSFAASVLADETEAAELGVQAVPAFVANRRFALSGVQNVAALEDMVTRAGAFDRDGNKIQI